MCSVSSSPSLSLARSLSLSLSSLSRSLALSLLLALLVCILTCQCARHFLLPKLALLACREFALAARLPFDYKGANYLQGFQK